MLRTSKRERARSPRAPHALVPSLRYEFADDEGRTLLVAHLIALSIGAAFLLLVHFAPPSGRVITLLPDMPTSIVLSDLPSTAAASILPRAITSAARGLRGSNAVAAAAIAGSDISAAFRDAGASRGMTGDARDILRNVAVSAGPTGTSGPGGRKVAIAAGGAIPGVTTPGLGGISAAGGGTIGAVGGRNGGIARAAVRVAAPPAVRVEPLTGAGGDAGAMGTYVRTHTSQLGYCYEERGLVIDPALAGSITVAMDVAANGTVRSSAVSARSWTGAGASGAEACILRAISSWRLPASERASSTYSFVFNFTR